MNQRERTLVHIDYAGHYVRKGVDVVWVSREDVHHAVVMKRRSDEVTFMLLIEDICKKMGVEEVRTALKVSYIPLLVDPKKPIYISDDEGLMCYLELYDDHAKSVLHVEVVSSQSQFVASNSDMVSSVREVYGNTKEAASEPSEHNAIVVHNEERGDMDTLFMNEVMEVTTSVGEEPATLEWEDGMNVEIGQQFETKAHVQEVVERAGHLNCFQYDVVNTDKKRYVVKCCGAERGCKWYLRATRHVDESFFSIRKYNSIHTCSRASSSTSTKRRCGTARLVASVLHDDFPGTLETPSTKNVVDLVQGRVGVKVSRSTAYRGKNKACENVRGSPEDSYKMLFPYMYMLKKMNPGTVTYVELDEEMKFLYLFFALGASIEGFSAMRKVIVVDGTHIKNAVGGKLIVATAQDPDHHHYPIAFGVVDGEKDLSLTWFFSKLKSVVPDSGDLVFVTDRHSSLIKSIAEVYPLAVHGYCTYHLSQNVKGSCSHVNKETVAKWFRGMAELYTECEFQKQYNAFIKRYPAAGDYLDKSCPETWKWARCYFPGDRYNIYTSNACESINGVLREARKYSLLPMIDVIVSKVAEWFNKNRQSSLNDGVLVPFIEKELHPLCAEAEKLKVTVLNSFFLEFNVCGEDGNVYLVDLKMKKCICRRFDLDKYPCVHAIAALMEARKMKYTEIEIHDLCSKYYWMSHWALAYCRTIYPVPHMSQWSIPEHIADMVVHPPEFVTKRGRPQVSRHPSVGEYRPRRRGNSRGGLYSYFDCSNGSGSMN